MAVSDIVVHPSTALHVQLFPSLTNPRKRFDDTKLRELADSMAPPVGILEPLVVRPLPADRVAALGVKGPTPFYEIVAGERRWRAAAIAKLETVPIVVRDVTDEQVLRLQLIENKNREDVHPLDEAEAMERLLKLNRAESPKTIAAAIGMSERYVQNRLHYLRLVPEVKAAFRDEGITAGHVDLLMRLPADDQKLAFKEGCFVSEFDFDGEKQTSRKVLASVRELDRWIKGHVRLSVAPKAPELELFPEVAAAVNEAAVANAPKLVELSDEWFGDKAKDAPLGRAMWRPVKKGEQCDHQVRGVLVLGTRRGTILTVCVGHGRCKKHFPETLEREAPRKPPENDPAGRRAKLAKQHDDQKERALRERRERLSAVWEHMLQEIAPKIVPDKPTPALLKLFDWNAGGGGHVKSWRDVAVNELGNVGSYSLMQPRVYAKVSAIVKALGIDLPRLEKEAELKAKGITAPLKPAPTKKAKPARESLSKKASAGTRKALAPRKRKAGKKR
jgi:ParB/RepB/Spo0J family partition protein